MKIAIMSLVVLLAGCTLDERVYMLGKQSSDSTLSAPPSSALNYAPVSTNGKLVKPHTDK